MADLKPSPGAPPRIVVVTEGGPHIWGIVNALTATFGPIAVFLEEPTSKMSILKGRARRLGFVSAAGQLGTMLIVRATKLLFPKAITKNVYRTGLDTTPPRDEQIVRIASANSPELPAALSHFGADVVLLAGCRMLSQKTLAAIACPVLNYHAGIAPKYRGTNGGYWALATADAENFGTTVHLVDAGVDTGAVLYQARGTPLPGDTIATYALTQAAFSRDVCAKAISDALAGTLKPIDAGTVSLQWYHPTLWAYLWTGIRRGVW